MFYVLVWGLRIGFSHRFNPVFRFLRSGSLTPNPEFGAKATPKIFAQKYILKPRIQLNLQMSFCVFDGTWIKVTFWRKMLRRTCSHYFAYISILKGIRIIKLMYRENGWGSLIHFIIAPSLIPMFHS